MNAPGRVLLRLSTEISDVSGVQASVSVATPNRKHRWRTVLATLVSVVMLKVLVMILWEYRNYFPPNYESAFLTGRRGSLVGVYGAAFYLHLLSGPVALLLGGWLLFSGPALNTQRCIKSVDESKRCWCCLCLCHLD